MQWIRSLVFNISMYLAMLVLAIVFFPFAIFSRDAAFLACHTYCRWVIWTARWMVGLRSEVRGTPPTGEVMIAAKHQSFLDILLIFHAIPRGKFIMKRELLFAPLIGQYAWRIGCVPVDRGKRGQAIAKMMRDVEAGQQSPGQLVIYPQGTRVAPGVSMPYKIGTGLLYEQLGQPCVPVATNVGVFWPKRAILRKPGLAVVEFLEPIAPGLTKDRFMKQMSEAIEDRSNALMAEAGFRGGRDAVD
jgi:1-acyl-sn-glycerol-3-phosphate acyltransferase